MRISLDCVGQAFGQALYTNVVIMAVEDDIRFPILYFIQSTGWYHFGGSVMAVA